jgi:hypothetical protein
MKGALLALSLAALAGPASAAFFAAAGKTDITPDLAQKTYYLAGHGATGRKATAVHDPLYARAVVLSDGSKTIAIVSVDVLGIFRKDVQTIRRELGWTDGNSYLFLAATHTHSAPDTVGLWGPLIGVSGVDRAWHAALLAKIEELVRGLAARVRPAKLQAASVELDPRGLCRDARPPIVIDPDLVALRFVASDGPQIGTIVRWSCHAEAAGRFGTDVTADFPGAMCRKLEQEGGVCLFLPGAIGGMMTPESKIGASDVAGRLKEIERIGGAVADAAEKSLKGAPLATPGRLDFSSTTVRVPVENSRYLLFLTALAFGHDVFDYKGRRLPPWRVAALSARHLLWPIRSDFPEIETEVSHLWIGPVEVLGMPNELFPELVLGGYDGEYSFGKPVVDPADPNAPDVSQAPRPPYLKDLMTGRIKMVTSISNDMLGYLIPGYDFKAAPSRSMLPEPPGEHYEETNSVGKSATNIILKAARELLKDSSSAAP